MGVRVLSTIVLFLIAALALACQQNESTPSVGVQRLAEEVETPAPQLAEQVVDLPPPESVAAAGLEPPNPAPVDPWLPHRNVAQRMGAGNIAVISARVVATTAVERNLPGSLNAMGEGVATRVDVEVEDTLCGLVSKGRLAVWHEGGTLADGRGYVTSSMPVLPVGAKAVLWLVRIGGDWFLYLGGASVFAGDNAGSFQVNSISGGALLSKAEIKQGGCP